jgi:hypothetical protein
MTVRFVFLLAVAALCLSFALEAFSRPYGARVTSHISDAVRKQVRHAIVPTLKTKRNKIEYPQALYFSRDQRYLAQYMEGGYISVWDLKNGQEIDNVSVKSYKPVDFAIDHNFKKLYLIDDNGQVYAKPLVGGEAFKRLADVQNKSYRHLAISNNSIILAADKELLVYNNKNLKQQPAKLRLNQVINDIGTSLAGSEILVSSANGAVSSISYNQNKASLTTRQSWNLSTDIQSILLSPDGNYFAIFLKNGRYAYASRSGGRFASLKQSGSRLNAIAIDDSRLTLITEDQELLVHDLRSGDINNKGKLELKPSDFVQSISNSRYILIPQRDAGIYMLEQNTRAKVAQLISTKSGWAVLDKKGRYDGNEDAFTDVSWDADGLLLELDQFSSKYFEPGLLAKLLQKKEAMITAPVAEIEKGLYLPPKVNISVLTSEGNARVDKPLALDITASVDIKPEELKDLHVYHNGKKIPGDKITLKKTYTSGEKGYKEWHLKVLPTKGNNVFVAEVSGWEGVVGQSNVAKLNVTRYSQADKKPATMFLRSIGINDYRGKELDLDFAVSDATDIYKEFSRSTVMSSKLTGEVKVLMLNQQATKAEILDLLEETRRQSTKDDMLVMFMSGHGMAINNKWYYLPAEASSLHDTVHVQNVGLAAKELTDKFVEIPSQKIVLIIDACQSGAATEDFNNFHQRRELRGLSRETGIHVIAATRADQLAPEYGELGHGLFTYTLLNGMRKNSQGYHNADLWPKDGKLMVSELQKYAAKFVPALAHAMATRSIAATGERGEIDERTLVTPVGSSQGQDFIIFK